MVLAVEELVVQAEAVMLLVQAEAVILVLEEVGAVIIMFTMEAMAMLATTITTGTKDPTEHQDVLFFYKLCLRSIILISICID